MANDPYLASRQPLPEPTTAWSVGWITEWRDLRCIRYKCAEAFGRYPYRLRTRTMGLGNQTLHCGDNFFGWRKLCKNCAWICARDNCSMSPRSWRHQGIERRIGLLHRLELGARHTVGEHHRANIDECIHRLRRGLGCSAYHQPAAAVPGKDNRFLCRVAALLQCKVRPALERHCRKRGFTAAHAGKIRRYHLMPVSFEQSFDIIKAPAAMPASVDQDETGH
jgi:hypothetical protein